MASETPRGKGPLAQRTLTFMDWRSTMHVSEHRQYPWHTAGQGHRCVRHLMYGFLAGALAVATFHQGMVFVLSIVGVIQSHVYALRGVPPFGVPTILNQMFWGGLW